MVPTATVTKVLTKQKNRNDNYNLLEQDAQFHSKDISRSNGAAQKICDHYDEALPKNDPKFLAPVRRWEKRMGFVTPVLWANTFYIALFHITVIFIIPAYFIIMRIFPLSPAGLFEIFVGGVSGFGVTAGAHRYWTHRAYKAKLPLRIIFMICFSVSGQNQIFDWVRDHRVHHKMSETSADPHDARRGFFFSHVGWLMLKKHREVIIEGNKIDMSDIVNDPVVKFHAKYFNIFKIAFCFLIPIVIKVVLFNDLWFLAIYATIFRYMASLHFTWSVNSFAHLWGNKPYDTTIMPVENWKVSFFAMGEGWHNYHHTFPWDYKAAELSYFLNITTFYIDLFARIGWAYDLKKASPALIEAIVKKKGYKKNDDL